MWKFQSQNTGILHLKIFTIYLIFIKIYCAENKNTFSGYGFFKTFSQFFIGRNFIKQNYFILLNYKWNWSANLHWILRDFIVFTGKLWYETWANTYWFSCLFFNLSGTSQTQNKLLPFAIKHKARRQLTRFDGILFNINKYALKIC